ncbi:MAG: hypothetical protein H6579_01775 [Chitinophagales bacterium]|nr:hypothetical protein [Chitinophagales bacterium]
MNRLILLFVLALLASCSGNKQLDALVVKNPDLNPYIDSLKTTSLLYKECENCALDGLEGTKLVGISDRYPPNGNFDHVEIELGTVEYASYQVYRSESEESSLQLIYFCFLNEEQKLKLESFTPFYLNRIAHFKQKCKIQFVGNTAVISIENLI